MGLCFFTMSVLGSSWEVGLGRAIPPNHTPNHTPEPDPESYPLKNTRKRNLQELWHLHVDMSTRTLTGYSWGAILAQVVFLDTRLPTSVPACYFQWKVPMDGVIEQSCGCPGTRVVCSIRGAVAGGVQLDVRRWDLRGAVAGGAAAELEAWKLNMLAKSESTLLVRSVGEHWKDGERFEHPIHIFFDISQLCHNHRATWTASAWHGTFKTVHMRCQCHSTNVMHMGQHSVIAPQR